MGKAAEECYVGPGILSMGMGSTCLYIDTGT